MQYHLMRGSVARKRSSMNAQKLDASRCLTCGVSSMLLGPNRTQGCVSCSPFAGALNFGASATDSPRPMSQSSQTFGLTSPNLDSLPSVQSRTSRGISPRASSQYSPGAASPRNRPSSVAGDSVDGSHGSHVAHHSASLQRSLCKGKTAGLLRCHTAAASLEYERARNLPGIRFVNSSPGPLSAASFVGSQIASDLATNASLESQRSPPRNRAAEISTLIEALAPSPPAKNDMYEAEKNLRTAVQRPQRTRTQEVWRGGWGSLKHVDQLNATEENMPLSLRKSTRQLMNDLQNMASFEPRSGIKSQGPCPDWELGETVGGHSRETVLGRRMMVAC